MLRPTRLLLALLLVVGTLTTTVGTAAATPEIWFPVQVDDQIAYSDTWGHPRSGGRTHKGVDIMTPQMQPTYAAASGWIRRAYGGDDRSCLDGGHCTSYGLLLHGDDGRSYFYLHLNDDTPGRPNGCDHRGGAENAFSPRLVQVLRDRGTLEPLPARWDPKDVVRVEQGELLGYIGSSGNAGCGVDHLHFETWAGHDFKSANDPSKDNPYPMVRAAHEAGRFWDQYGPIDPVETERLAGEDRIRTAIAISAEAFRSSRYAVIAPAESYAEALVSAPLAASLQAPVLLHWGRTKDDGTVTIDPALVEELDRLGTRDVLVLSSGDAMSPAFDDALAEAADLDRDRIVRFGGTDRYDLSVQVAEELLRHHGWPTEPEAEEEPGLLDQLLGPADEGEDVVPTEVSPILALGEHPVADRGWPDALAAATLAAAERSPILLTRPDALPEAAHDLLAHEGVGEVRIVGGTAAIAQAVEDRLNEDGHETRRLAGENRYETALAIAGELQDLGHDIDDVFVATGENFPDAMAAGAAVAAQKGILLLVHGEVAEASPSVLSWLRAEHDEVAELTAIGGPRAISDRVLTVAAIHANWPDEA